MKKIIAAGAAAVLMSFSATSAFAYTPTTDTDVSAKHSKIKPGKKAKIKVKPGVTGDVSQCTGVITLIYKNGKKVTRQRSKPVANKVVFNGKVPKGTTKIIAVYQRGKKDPCAKSSTKVWPN